MAHNLDWVISVDDHLLEGPTTFTRVPAKFRDKVPQWVEEDGRPAWEFAGKKFDQFAAAQQGRFGKAAERS